MPQDTSPSEEQKGEHPKEGISIDLDSILLPDKELHTPGNAQRANAGKLVEQEQSATLNTPPAPPLAGLATGSPLAGAKKPDTSIAPLQTYQSDIQNILSQQGSSVVSIAAAQANRRSRANQNDATLLNSETETPGVSWGQIGKRVLFTIGGIALVAAAVGAVAYVLLQPHSVAVSPAAQVPFISVNDSKSFLLQPSDGHTVVLNNLQSLKSAESLTPGLVASFIPMLASTSPNVPAGAMSAQQFFSLLAPTMPATLVRNLDASFLIGVHSFNQSNQPFIILSTDSYEQGYAGMLAWEATMPRDLAPFFPASTNMGTSTPGFTDQTILNHDVRALVDVSGNATILWTFLDRQTIVVTNNQYTLGEIISRLTSTPITPVPGQ